MILTVSGCPQLGLLPLFWGLCCIRVRKGQRRMGGVVACSGAKCVPAKACPPLPSLPPRTSPAPTCALHRVICSIGKGGRFEQAVPKDWTGFAYVYQGTGLVGGTQGKEQQVGLWGWAFTSVGYWLGWIGLMQVYTPCIMQSLHYIEYNH